jgi:hypothetical protein
VVDEAIGDARLFGDIAHAARVIALLGKRSDGGVENLPAPLFLSSGSRSHENVDL